MPMLKWKRSRFNVTDCLLDRATFDAWISKEGGLAWLGEFRRTRARWFFGRRRARRNLYRRARALLQSDGPFARAVERRLNRLPQIIHKIAVFLRRKGYSDFYSIDASRALFVIPRGLVESELIVVLAEELSAARQLQTLEGLSIRVLKDVSRTAEGVFFEYLMRGRQYVDPDGRGIILSVDPGFRWRLSELDGHYYYACPAKHIDLNNRGQLRRFKSEMEEIVFGQRVYLNRLDPDSVAAITSAFQAPT
jgi:hypothetical protein